MESHEEKHPTFQTGAAFVGKVPKSSNICCVKDAAYVRGFV